MFGNKRFKAIEERLANLEQFEKSVSTICENYFATNEKGELSFSTGCTADKFYQFVKSVNDRVSKFERAIADGELVSKEWHDEQVAHLQDENEKLKDEIASDNDEIACKDDQIDKLNAVIKTQEKEIKELSKTKTATAKGGKK